MAEATISVEGVIADFPSPILLKIDKEPTREVMIDLHLFITGNSASVALNIVGGQHGHLALLMTAEDYMEQTIFAFVPLYNPGGYPHSIGSTQEQVLRTEKFRQNQAMFRKYTAMDGALKKKIVMAVEPVFL